MRFFVDANLPRSVVEVLVELGFEATFAKDAGLGSAPDVRIAQRVKDTTSVLLTRDLDFADVRRYPPADFSGIVVLRLPEDMIAKDIAQVVQRFLNATAYLASLPGRLAIVETDRVRFRPPLP